MIDGDDLAERLRNANRTLCAMASHQRRQAAIVYDSKAEGVRLALSYVEEALRGTDADR
jgi:hypothetical protein